MGLKSASRSVNPTPSLQVLELDNDRNPLKPYTSATGAGGGPRRFLVFGVTSTSDFRFFPQFEPFDEDEPSFEFSSPRRGLNERPLVRPISKNFQRFLRFLRNAKITKN